MASKWCSAQPGPSRGRRCLRSSWPGWERCLSNVGVDGVFVLQYARVKHVELRAWRLSARCGNHGGSVAMTELWREEGGGHIEDGINAQSARRKGTVSKEEP